MEAFLLHIGVNASDVFAGFAGGVVATQFVPKASPLAMLWAVLTGTLTAAYLGPAAPTFIGMKSSPQASFIIGLVGTPICRGLIAWSRRARSPMEERDA